MGFELQVEAGVFQYYPGFRVLGFRVSGFGFRVFQGKGLCPLWVYGDFRRLGVHFGCPLKRVIIFLGIVTRGLGLIRDIISSQQ